MNQLPIRPRAITTCCRVAFPPRIHRMPAMFPLPRSSAATAEPPAHSASGGPSGIGSRRGAAAGCNGDGG